MPELASSQEIIEVLYNLHADEVYEFAYHSPGGSQDARDVVQEVFVRALQSAHQFRHESTEKTWLLRNARNLIYDFQRKAAAGVNDFTITHVTQGTPYILHDWRTQPANLASDSNYSHHYSEAVAVPIRAVIMGKWTNETFHCVSDIHGQWKVAADFLNNFEFWDVPYGTDARTNSTS